MTISGRFVGTAGRMWRALLRWVATTPEGKWTAAGIGLGFGIALIVMPGFGIAVFGTAFAGWWFGVALATVFGGLLGNRWGIVEERRRAQDE